MAKVLSLIVALTLCLASAGCAASGKETAVPETVATGDAVETTTETQSQETAAETTPVLEEPVGEYYKSPNFNFYCDDTEALEVYDCRMYPVENGTTIFAVDYKTVAGLQPIIFGYADDGNDDPNYWNEVDILTTDEKTTFLFEMENEVMDQIYHPCIFFRDQYGFQIGLLEIFHRDQRLLITDGNPVGEAETLVFTKEGNITVHNAFMQPLDNGYVRFTLECQPRKDLYICFYSDPEGAQFICYNYADVTSGKKVTITADLRAEDVEGLHGFNFSFYKPGEYPDSRVYLNSATANFDELVATNFDGFIGNNGQFMLVYYGVIDEAVLGATLTAEDGSSVVITEKTISKNGDGHSLLIFKEFKAKRQDTVSVTLYKEGYEDISLELYVH